MNFEYDPEKSAVNLTKHGIDFKTARALWGDRNVLEIPAKTTDGPHFLTIGKIDGKYWSAITTYSNKNIRIISVRRAREQEVEYYESAQFR